MVTNLKTKMIRSLTTSSFRFVISSTTRHRSGKLNNHLFLNQEEKVAFTKRSCFVRAVKVKDYKSESTTNESPAERLREADVGSSSHENLEDEVFSLDTGVGDDTKSKRNEPSDEVYPEESITARLRRLSMTSAEKFVPSAGAKTARQKQRARHAELEEAYENRHSQRSNYGFNKNRSNFRRYFSTNTTRDPNEKFVDEADIFGTIVSSNENDLLRSSGPVLSQETLFDEEEEDDIRFKPDENWTRRKLKFKIKELARDRKIIEAIDTLTTAHKEGNFDYNKGSMTYLYAIVISVCAEFGYVRMAFKLLTGMKKRGLKPGPGIYTSLFNACGNSPWHAEENIKRINNLRRNMFEKNIQPNLVNCNAMIKAYGRCGDISSAFAVVDEIKAREALTSETFNFLLQACISDKENGFRHMIVTLEKMKSHRMKSDIYTYNLILRAIRECGIQYFGPKTTPPVNNDKTESGNKSHKPVLPRLTSKDANTMVDLIASNSRGQFNTETAISHMTTDSILQALNTLPENRLAVFGGLRGFLSLMKRDKVHPNIKTMMEFVQVVNPLEFTDVMKLLKEFKIRPDIDFFNLMIRRYQVNRQKENAVDVLKNLYQYNLNPNIMTWGVLSMGCSTWVSAKSLLQEMEEASFMPNLIIMETLLTNAIEAYDSLYVIHMMHEMKSREIKPNSSFVLKLQNFRDEVQQGIIRKEMGKEVTPLKLGTIMEENKNFESNFVKFKTRFNVWMKGTEMIFETADPWEEDFRKRYPLKTKEDANKVDEELMEHYNV